MSSTCIACKGCTKRCVEPLCRNSCEAWQEHIAERAVVYRERENGTRDSVFYMDTVAGKRFQKRINCWRRNGR